MSRIKKIVVFLCFLICANNALAKKSVFIISRHNNPSHAQAYSIEGTQVVYQADVDISTYNPGIGAVANAIWPEKELMFVTYESSDWIVWSSTKTLEKVGEYDTGINDDFAGIVVDQGKELVYTIRRNCEDLYVYSFDDVNNTVVLEDTNELETSSGYIDGWGLALDEDNDLLYVTDESNRVRDYNTTDWSLEGYIDITVDSNDRKAVGIAVDPVRRYMYTAGFYGTGGYHNYLVRT